MEGSLSEGPSPLLAAVVNDATAWVMLAIALALAPIESLYDAVDLPRPDPPGLGIALAVPLVAAAAALAVKRTRGAVIAAATGDAVGAVAVGLWLTTDPADGIGTVLLFVLALSFAAQAAVDVWALTRPTQ